MSVAGCSLYSLDLYVATEHVKEGIQGENDTCPLMGLYSYFISI